MCLHLMAKDDTAETKFILLDWVATLVIGVKAEKILMALSMSLKGGDTKFKVLKVWSVYNTLMVYFQYETMFGKGTIAISGSEGSLLTYSDESSGKMTTPSKRSCGDIVDHPDTTSTSKVRPVKRIKVDKMINDELSIKKNTKAGESVSGCSPNTMF
ncbi:hypothetical protein HID58_043552 [Brassica napus]|uniref:Uncharacterized protein n=1 Tax=Brassica napus TaxID=3708 RepID=A0ABQ8BGX0_BRANA|nr:hypothetical protein HID58_043552 [Brassica napus]